MEQNYRVLDSDNGIVACTIEEMAEIDKKYIVQMGGELDKLTFYFDKEHDLIVLNESNAAFKEYADLVITAMGITEEGLLHLYASMPEDMKHDFGNLIKILLVVKKYRKLKGGSRT